MQTENKRCQRTLRVNVFYIKIRHNISLRECNLKGNERNLKSFTHCIYIFFIRQATERH